MGNNKPSGGYPTKSLHIKALWNAGVATSEIATTVDVAEASIYQTLHRLRQSGHDDIIDRPKNGRRGKATDTRGIWTPEKLAKAHRLFGKIMIYVAEALDVPPKELLEYGLKGVMPPMGKAQRVAQLLEERASQADDAESEIVPSPPAAPTPAPQIPPLPSRDDDEAELARLEEENGDEDATGGDRSAGDGRNSDGTAGAVAPALAAALRVPPRFGDAGGPDDDEEEAEAPSPAEAEPPAEEKPRRYRITDGAGRYVLAAPGKGMTLNKALAWTGTAQELEQLFKQWPALKDLDPERVP